MPIINIMLLEGRTQEQKQKLVSAITDAVHESIGAPKDTVRIILNETPTNHFAVGGEFKFAKKQE
jgi:4-oxalocrotonate tautomerase